MKLDIINEGPKDNLTQLEPDQNISGQLWRFLGNADGTFRLLYTITRHRLQPWICSLCRRSDLTCSMPSSWSGWHAETLSGSM